MNPADAFDVQHPSQPLGRDWTPLPASIVAADVALVFPNYIVRALRGAGGMGAVYLADELDLTPEEAEAIRALAAAEPKHIVHLTGYKVRRRVALKLLRHDKLHDKSYVFRFDREIRGHKTLKHEHIVPCIDDGITPDGQRFYVMPWLDGRSLAERLAEPVRLRPDQIGSWMVQICSGATYMHAHGWFHRDFKAANIITDDDLAIIVDLGVAREAAAPSTLTGRDGNPGTYGHTAPELLPPEQRKADAISDVYSLTALLNTLLMGKVPTIDELPSRYGFPHFDIVWEKGLAADRSRRYQSADALAQAIKQAVDATRLLPTPPPLASLATPPASLPKPAAKANTQPEPSLATGPIALPFEAVTLKVLHDQVTAIVGAVDGRIAAVNLRTGKIICTEAAEDATGHGGKGRAGRGENSYIAGAFFFLERAPAPQCFYTMSHSGVLKTWIFDGKFQLLSSAPLLDQNFEKLHLKIVKASRSSGWSTWTCYSNGVADMEPRGIVDAKFSPDGSSILCLTELFAIFRCDLTGRLRDEPVVVGDAFNIEPANRDGSQVWVGKSSSGASERLLQLNFGKGLVPVSGSSHVSFGSNGIHTISEKVVYAGGTVFSPPSFSQISTSELWLSMGHKPLPIPETGHVLSASSGTVCAYDIQTLRTSGEFLLAGHEGDVRCIDAFNAGANVVSLSAQSLRIWDFKARAPIGGYPSENDFMPVGTFAGYSSNCFRIWDGRVFCPANNKAAIVDPGKRSFVRLNSEVRAVGVAAGKNGEEVHILSLGRRQMLPGEYKRSLLGTIFKQPTPEQFLLRHHRVLAGGITELGTTVLADGASRLELGSTCIPESNNSRAIDIGSGRFAILTAGHLAIYDTASRALVAGPLDISKPPAGVDESTSFCDWLYHTQIAVSPDGLTLFARGPGKPIKICRALDLGGQREVAGSEGRLGLLIPWLDSRHVLFSIKTKSGKEDSHTEKCLLMLADCSTGTILGSLGELHDQHEDPCGSVLVGQGTMLAHGSYRGLVVLDLMSGKYLSEPIAHPPGSISSVSLCPGGREIMTTSSDGTARFWDISKIVQGRTSQLAASLPAWAKPVPAEWMMRD